MPKINKGTYSNPSCLQTTLASRSSKASSHTTQLSLLVADGVVGHVGVLEAAASHHALGLRDAIVTTVVLVLVVNRALGRQHAWNKVV